MLVENLQYFKFHIMHTQLVSDFEEFKLKF